MKEQIPQAELIAGIDIAAEGTYCGVGIIRPDEISNLPSDTIIIVAAPSAQEPAKELLSEMKRPFVLLKGSSAEWFF